MIKGQWILGKEDLSIPIGIRKEVFEEELGLNCYGPGKEDEYAMHCILEEDNVPVATSRVYFDGDRFMLDAICVKKEYRHQLIGDLLTRVTILKAADFAETMYIHCFADIADFFKRYGFKDTLERDRIGSYDAAWLCADRGDIKFMGACGECRDCHGCKTEK